MQLNSSNRYAPVVTAIIFALALAAFAEVVRRAQSNGLTSRGALRGGALIMCALPSLLVGIKFVWDWKRVPTQILWSLLPLNLVPSLLSHSRPLYDLGGAGLVMAIGHLILARRVRRAGDKFT